MNDKTIQVGNNKKKIWTIDFITIFGIATLLAIVTQLQATTFPLYVQHLGGNLALAGIMTSFYMGTSAVCKPFVGKLIVTKSKKKMFLIFGLIFSCILFSYGFLSSILMIIIIRVISSPCYSVCSTSSVTMATDLIPNERLVEGIGYYNLSQTIASAVGASIALYIINTYGFKSLFGTASVIAFVSVLLCLLVKYKEQIRKEDTTQRKVEDKPRYSLGTKIKALFNGSMFFPCIMMFFILIGSSGTVTYLPTWGKANGFDNIGIFFTVQAITLTISRIVVGRLNKKLGATTTILIGIICVIIALVGIRFCTTIPMICALSLLLGWGTGTIVPTMHAFIVSLAKETERGMANSLFQMSNDAGICMCSLVLGIFSQNFGIGNVFTFAAIFPIIAIGVFFVKVRKQIKQEKNWR